MASEFFAKIGDIQGESQDDKHRGEIQLIAWSWGVVQSGPIASGGGGASGKPNFSDLNITHAIDKASPNLLKACATGQHINEATITMRKAGTGRQEFLVIRMNDVIITGVHQTGAGNDGGLVENVSIQCGKVSFAYSPQRPDGSLDTAVTFNYDIRANRVI
jgi:type VI secretion system secreted protein Hcp